MREKYLGGQSIHSRAQSASLGPVRETGSESLDSLSRIGHDLRNPLHIIMGSADLLTLASVGGLNSKQRELVGNIKRQAEAILEMADQLAIHRSLL